MKNFFIIFLIFSATAALAKKPTIRTGNVYASQGQSLKEVLISQVRLPKSLVENKTFIKRVLKDNPHLSNSRPVRAGQNIYLEIPYNTRFTTKSGKPNSRSLASTNIKSQKKLNSKNPDSNSKTSINFFFTVSQGTFTETADGVTATTQQNSPGTIGVAVGSNVDDTFSYSGSAYISALTGTGENLSDDTLEIPPEYGITSYLNYKDLKFLTPYTGFDFESFSTFNTDERILGEPLKTREHRILFATLGISKAFKLFNQSLFLKTSISQSLYTNSSEKSLTDDSEFSGQKFILFLATPVYKNVSAHLLYKQHFLTGPTELVVSRLGLGISYNL